MGDFPTKIALTPCDSVPYCSRIEEFMGSRSRLGLALCCSALAVGCVTQDRKPSASVAEITAEVQYRPSIDSTCAYSPIKFPRILYNREEEVPQRQRGDRFPLVEVFLTNRGTRTLEFTKMFLDQREINKFPETDVIWYQFYPAPVVRPGEAALLQICLVKNPAVRHRVDLEAKTGERISVRLPPFAFPKWEIIGVTFSPDFAKACIAYLPSNETKAGRRSGLIPTGLTLNGKNLLSNCRVLDVPHETCPGMLSIDLPEPLRSGAPVHLRLTFRGGRVAQCLLRASSGITVDAYGVDEKDEKLRKELGLDLQPIFQELGADPSCEDSKVGSSIPAISEMRRKAYEESNARLSSLFLCVTAWPQIFYPVYGQCADALQVNPYRLQYSGIDDDPKFVEKEENFFRWGWLAARPRPWCWAPEACLFRKRKFERMIEPQELRLLTYAALGHGARGIKYYTYGSGEGWIGFQESKALVEEIKKLNAEIKLLEPILAQAIPISIRTMGGSEGGIRLYTLWSDHSGGELTLIARSLAYESSREPNWGEHAAARFKHLAIHNDKVEVIMEKPTWLQVDSVIDALDASHEISWRAEGEKLRLAFPKRLVTVARIRNESRDNK